MDNQRHIQEHQCEVKCLSFSSLGMESRLGSKKQHCGKSHWDISVRDVCEWVCDCVCEWVCDCVWREGGRNGLPICWMGQAAGSESLAKRHNPPQCHTHTHTLSLRISGPAGPVVGSRVGTTAQGAWAECRVEPASVLVVVVVGRAPASLLPAGILCQPAPMLSGHTHNRVGLFTALFIVQ